MLLNTIINAKAKDELCVVFIDFKCAYNTILRKKLWKYLRTLTIFTEEEINFIKTLIDKLHFKC